MDFDDSLSEEIGTKIPQVAANMTNGDEGVFTSKLHEKQTVQFPRARHIAVKVFGWKVVWNHYFQKQLDVLCCILSLSDNRSVGGSDCEDKIGIEAADGPHNGCHQVLELKALKYWDKVTNGTP
ncbi:hypothetical protein QL285_046636 [Trifolium repens]|nr:hypothetical protein QL285_046636 [Trifolium repens]